VTLNDGGRWEDFDEICEEAVHPDDGGSIRNVMVVPVRPTAGASAIGVITLVNKREEGFTASDRRLAIEIFSHLALIVLAIVQGEQATYVNSQMNTLLKYSRAFLADDERRSPPRLIGDIMDSVAALGVADRITLHLGNQKKEGVVWTLDSSCCLNDEVIGKWATPSEVVSHVLATGEVMNLDENHHVAFSEVDSLANFHTSALIAMPLCHAESFAGVIVARLSTSGSSFSARDEELLTALSGIVSYTFRASQQKSGATWNILMGLLES